MKSPVRLLLIFCFLSANPWPVHAQRFVISDFIPDLDELKEEEKTKILKFFKSMKHVRKSVYGNVHAVFESTEITNKNGEKKHSKYKYEYWAKDDQFYRIDVTTLESLTAEDVGTVYRNIVRPEGAATLTQKEPGGWFRLAHLYSTQDGYDGITTMPIYQTSTLANCLDGITLAETLFLKPQNEFRKKLEKIRFNGDRCYCNISIVKTDGPYIVDFSFNKDEGVILTLDGIKQRGSDLIRRRKVENDYNFEKFRQIPVRHREIYDSPEDQVYKSVDFVTLEADFQPIAMEIFAAPENVDFSGVAFRPQRFGGLPVWMKLLLIVGAGLLLLGFVLLFLWLLRMRKRKRSAGNVELQSAGGPSKAEIKIGSRKVAPGMDE